MKKSFNKLDVAEVINFLNTEGVYMIGYLDPNSFELVAYPDDAKRIPKRLIRLPSPSDLVPYRGQDVAEYYDSLYFATKDWLTKLLSELFIIDSYNG